MGILHIGPDWPFYAHVVNQFEAALPGASRYVVIADSPVRNLPKGTADSVLPDTLAGAIELARTIRGSDRDGIVVHGMNPRIALAILAARGRNDILWSGWGYDYYPSRNDSFAGLLDPVTADFWQGHDRRPLQNTRGRLERMLYSRVARKAKYFSAPVPSDLSVFVQRFPMFTGTYLQLQYGSLEDVYLTGETILNGNGSVLFGNSATPTNNHLDAFPAIEKLIDAGLTIVCPLNYGYVDYAQHVARLGKDRFGDAFIPLLDRLPLEEYNALISQCHVVLMNHRRQQGLGNILTALGQGAHVYLNAASPVYQYLTSIGINVSDIGSLHHEIPNVRRSLDETAHVEAALMAHWSREAIQAGTGVVASQLSPRS